MADFDPEIRHLGDHCGMPDYKRASGIIPLLGLSNTRSITMKEDTTMASGLYYGHIVTIIRKGMKNTRIRFESGRQKLVPSETIKQHAQKAS